MKRYLQSVSASTLGDERKETNQPTVKEKFGDRTVQFHTHPSANSRGLFGDSKMGFIGATKVGTNPFGQLASRQHPVQFDHLAFAVGPFRFNRVEPGTLGRQQKRQKAYPFARLLDLLMVSANPGTHLLAEMPGSVIPNQEPVGLAQLGEALTTPVQKLGGDGADGATSDEAPPHLRTVRRLWRPFLPENALTGHRLGIGIVFAPGLFHQAYRLIVTLPGMRHRQGKPTPPDFIGKANRPRGLLAGPGDQAVSCGFCAGTAGRDG